MSTQDDRPTDEELLAVVQGRAAPDLAARVEDHAARDPEVAADLALMKGMRSAMASAGDGVEPGPLGWARLSRSLDAERDTARPRQRSFAGTWQLAAAAVAAVAIWQFAAVPLLQTGGTDGARYQTVSESAETGFALSVAFAPTATEQALRALIREIDGEVTGGPSALGLWRISFGTAAERDAARERLEAAAIVESVQVD